MKRLAFLLVLVLAASPAVAQHGDAASPGEPVVVIYGGEDSREVSVESERAALTLVIPSGHYLRVEAAGAESSVAEAGRGLFRGDVVLSTLPAANVGAGDPLEEAFAAAATNRLELRGAVVRVVRKALTAHAPSEPFLR